MKILTLNTWQKRGPWQERWQVLLEGLAHLRPDIVGFQELFDSGWAETVRRAAGYPHLVFSNEKAGLVFLSRYPVLRSSCLVMKTQAPSEEYLRYSLFAEVDAGGKPLALFNTHLSWRPEEGPIREAQAAELLADADLKADGRETLAMGDFNAAPGTPEINRMTHGGGFADIYGCAHPGDPGITWDNAHPYVQMASTVLPDRRIDFLFARNRRALLGNLVSARRVYLEPDSRGIFATDHYGVLAEFRTVP
ncbi:MAG: endonuclease/exonuclease/phosphatase family protein [Candidatus Omnitrophota bacterium]